MSFTTIKNGVDERLIIIRHDESGFYNITKTASLIHKLKNANTENDSSDLTKASRVNNWFRNKDTTRLFNGFAKVLNQPAENLKFEIRDGLYDHRGTYVHPKIYDQFVMWLDVDYAASVAVILEKFHSDANRIIIQEKEDSIRLLTKKIDEEREAARLRDEAAQRRDEEQRLQIAELLGYAKKTTDQNCVLETKIGDLKDHNCVLETKIDGLHQVVDEVKDHLEDKSMVSTMNPSDDKLHHHALITTKRHNKYHVYKFSSGQSHYIDKVRAELQAGDYAVHKDKFYQANGIDYRRNVEKAVSDRKKSILAIANIPIIAKREELAREIAESNAMAIEDVNQWNADLAERVRIKNLTAKSKIKLASNGKRYYYGRNQTYERLRDAKDYFRSYDVEVLKPEYALETIPINIGSLSITWYPNKYISKTDLERIFDEVNTETQTSPYPSSGEETSVSMIPSSDESQYDSDEF